MQCQALVVNSSEEPVLVHSLCNAEDVLKKARGKKKNHFEIKIKKQDWKLHMPIYNTVSFTPSYGRKPLFSK